MRALLTLQHGLRDLRGGVRHLRLLLVCLALGVAVMSCIGSMISGLRTGINRDSRSLLGGDIEIRQIYKPIPDSAIAWLRHHSQALSQGMTMRAMTATGDNRTLVELKGIDDRYPLYGKLELKNAGGPVSPQAVFFNRPQEHLFGAAVEPSLLDALNMQIGQRFSIGNATYEVRAVIVREPDRSVNALTLGPRVMVSRAAIEATGLITFGTLIHFQYRVQLPPDTDLPQWKRQLAAVFPDAHWNVHDWHDSAPGLLTLVDRLSLFFALTGVTTLIVAGIGISNATQVYMWSKRQTIATMKCLGASQSHINRIYLLQLLIAGGAAILAGLVIGTLCEVLLLRYLDDVLPVSGQRGLYLLPLALSGGLGVLTLLLFTLLPLRQAGAIKPTALFRGDAADQLFPLPLWERVRERGMFQQRASRKQRPHPTLPLKGGGILSVYFLLIAGMVALSIVFTRTVNIPLYFAGGLLASLMVFYAISAAIKRFAAGSAHKGYKLTLSMALANLARPGAATSSMVIALGIGMTLLIALALVGENLRDQLEQGLPEHAPAFFLMDIQPSERTTLMDKLKAIPQVQRITDLPMVRGRIIKLNGIPVDKTSIDPNARWALQTDRGLTYDAVPPANTRMTEGKWWSKDYHGAPLVSFDANLARGMGLKLGDTITIAALDKEITATIANLRDIQWGTMEMNFAIILSPGALNGLPVTYLATIKAPPGGEKPIQAMMAKDFPQVAVVHVREALSGLSALLAEISTAVLVTAAMTILCGVLVMASAIHASLHKRMYDTVMLKVLGVTRGRILRIYLTEFMLVALSAALVSVIIGSLAAYGVMQLMIFPGFRLMPPVVISTLAGSVLFAVGLGSIATHFALKIRPLALLRNE